MPMDNEKKGYLIFSPYNPNIVVLDGTNMPYSICCKIKHMYRSFHEDKCKVDNLLLEERANYSRMLRFKLKHISKQDKKIRFYRNRNMKLLNDIQKYKTELRVSNDSLENLQEEVESQLQEILEMSDLVEDLKKEVQSNKDDFRLFENNASEERMQIENTLLERMNEVAELEEENSDLKEKVTDLENQLNELTLKDVDHNMEDIHECIVS